MENWDGLNESDNPQQQTKSDSELWDFPKTDPVTASSLINRFILACPAPGREVDLDIFKAQIAAMLVMVPPGIAATVMDPYKGLAVKLEFFPVPKVVSDAIAKEMEPYYRDWERRRRAEEFKRVAGPPIPEYQNRKTYQETLHDKFKHLSDVPKSQLVPGSAEWVRIQASVAKRAAETIAILKAKRTKQADAAAESIQALAEQMTGKPL